MTLLLTMAGQLALRQGRHFDQTSLPTGALHPLWLTSDGINSHKHRVTFEEMREALRLLSRVANRATKGQFDPASIDDGK